MAGEILYAGGELDSVEIIAGAPSYQSAEYAAPYSRGSIKCGHQLQAFRFRCYDSSSAETSVGVGDQVFVHYVRSHLGDFNANFQPASLIRDAAGVAWLGVFPVPFTTPYLALYLSDGAGNWTKLSDNVSYASHNLIADDVRIALDAAGNHTIEWSVSQNQVYIGTLSGSTSRPSWNDVAMVDCSAWEFGGGICFSQLLITKNISTIGGHVFTSGLDGAGTYSAWSGSYTDINELDLSDTTNIQTASAGDKWSGTTSNITTPAGYIIPSAFIWTRAKDSGVSPENVDVLIRSGGTDYFEPLASPSVSYANTPLRMDTDPVGSLWTDTTWNAAERGVRSVA